MTIMNSVCDKISVARWRGAIKLRKTLVILLLLLLLLLQLEYTITTINTYRRLLYGHQSFGATIAKCSA